MALRTILITAGLLVATCATHAADSSLRQSIAADYPHLDALFKHLHANPELSLQEVQTAARLATELQAQGFEVHRGVGKTGVVALLRNLAGPTLMIRADMDALPVLEKTGLPYASSVRQVNLDGEEMPVMHACGHGMHVTTLVWVARRMAALKDRWHGTLMLVGQPAEEALGGAKGMVADNLYPRFGRPNFALAVHVIAKYPAGKIAFSDGLMYSSADTVTIRVRSVATHGASPHLGNDPVVVGSQIVLALQHIVTREISPIEPALITVGAFHAGSAPNVITDEARLELTVRANSEATRKTLLRSIERVAINTARGRYRRESFAAGGNRQRRCADHHRRCSARAARARGDALVPSISLISRPRQRAAIGSAWAAIRATSLMQPSISDNGRRWRALQYEPVPNPLAANPKRVRSLK